MARKYSYSKKLGFRWSYTENGKRHLTNRAKEYLSMIRKAKTTTTKPTVKRYMANAEVVTLIEGAEYDVGTSILNIRLTAYSSTRDWTKELEERIEGILARLPDFERRNHAQVIIGLEEGVEVDEIPIGLDSIDKEVTGSIKRLVEWVKRN